MKTRKLKSRHRIDPCLCGHDKLPHHKPRFVQGFHYYGLDGRREFKRVASVSVSEKCRVKYCRCPKYRSKREFERSKDAG